MRSRSVVFPINHISVCCVCFSLHSTSKRLKIMTTRNNQIKKTKNKIIYENASVNLFCSNSINISVGFSNVLLHLIARHFYLNWCKCFWCSYGVWVCKRAPIAKINTSKCRFYLILKFELNRRWMMTNCRVAWRMASCDPTKLKYNFFLCFGNGAGNVSWRLRTLMRQRSRMES